MGIWRVAGRDGDKWFGISRGFLFLAVIGDQGEGGFLEGGVEVVEEYGGWEMGGMAVPGCLRAAYCPRASYVAAPRGIALVPKETGACNAMVVIVGMGHLYRISAWGKAAPQAGSGTYLRSLCFSVSASRRFPEWSCGVFVHIAAIDGLVANER